MQPTTALTTLMTVLAAAGCTESIEATVAQASAGMPVYLIAGQSNAVGGASAASLPPNLTWYAQPYGMPWAQEINCPRTGWGACELSTSWLGVVTPHGPTTAVGTRLGVELSAGRRLRERFGAIALLKQATNGTSLAVDWDSTGTWSQWDYLHAFVDARLAEFPNSYLAGLLWIQGNGDAATPAAAGDYAENLAWFVKRLRQDYGCVPVVLDRLHPQAVLPYRDVVRAEQLSVAQFLDDVVVVETDDLAFRDGIQHYDAASMVTLGLRMADAMPATPATCP